MKLYAEYPSGVTLAARLGFAFCLATFSSMTRLLERFKLADFNVAHYLPAGLRQDPLVEWKRIVHDFRFPSRTRRRLWRGRYALVVHLFISWTLHRVLSLDRPLTHSWKPTHRKKNTPSRPPAAIPTPNCGTGRYTVTNPENKSLSASRALILKLLINYQNLSPEPVLPRLRHVSLLLYN